MSGGRDPLPADDAIAEAVRNSSRGPLKAKDLARALGVSTAAYKGFKRRLSVLEREGRIYRVKGQRYAVPEKINLVVGRLSVIRSGDGFVRVEEGRESQDVFIPSASLESAMDEDRVVARIESHPRGRNPVGRVIKVLDRAHPTVVGTYHRSRRFGTVVPDDRKIQKEILVPRGEEGGASDGDVVVVRLTGWGTRKMNPTGEVETVLGRREDPGVDVLAVIHGHGLPLDFPQEVEDAAREVVRARRHDGGEGRVDRRDLHVFTIDPSDAKDHDDALSVTRAGEGLWEVGIHIADVSFYVERGDAIDVEALRRATSVYLVDRVVPMLPHALSSDACSLRPEEDRLAVSVFATLDLEGRVRSHRFERTVVRSRHRLSYEDAEVVLQGDGSVDGPTDDALRRLDDLARILRRKREQRGSLDFDLPEARVILGSEGEPVDIQRVLRLTSHRLIEDFMLLANELVARLAADLKLPVLYRVHEPPTRERLEELRDFLAGLGHPLPRRAIRPKDLQRVLERVEGRPEDGLVSTVLLRSMNRARYEVENLGHFGLATRWYAHFTSPIRRYPDLVVHRVVVRALVEAKSVPEEWAGDELRSVAEHTSERERVADEAERDSVELKKIEFMQRHLGDEFTGTVSGVTSFGFFVLLDRFFVEGLVHVNALRDDYYIFQEERYALLGERTGRRFQLGDRVRIRVARTDKEERHIDFELLASLSASELGSG